MITENIYDELVKFRGSPVERPEGPTEEIKYLVSNGLIRTIKTEVLPDLCLRDVAWEITVPGKNALAEFEDEAHQRAENKKQQRFQNKVSVAQVLVPAITFILGLIVEHTTGIVEICLGLLRLVP